ncbi:hypothetical protein BPORC_1728 [Bifidobacterium porcinum]|nr:hypothetical protein BPORC_1728 [Bifidobacterium porcinum]
MWRRTTGECHRYWTCWLTSIGGICSRCSLASTRGSELAYRNRARWSSRARWNSGACMNMSTVVSDVMLCSMRSVLFWTPAL